jgi:hypothetical protein
MKNLALLLLLAAPVAVHAQGLSLTAPGQSSGGRVLWQAPFATPGCYASGQTAGASSAISITRTTSATYIDGGGAIQTCTSGQFRVAPDGLLVEPARTQFIINNTTHPKTGEATGSITAQACVGWHEGTGTMTIAAGTATVTGLSCTTVAAGTLCPFTVTVAGTMAVTTTTGTTRAQIECPGSYRTSFITTAGTATARNADQISATVPSITSGKWCLATTASLLAGTTWAAQDGASARMWSMGANGATNTQSLRPAFLDTYDGTPTRKYWSWTPSAAAGTIPIRYMACSTGPAVYRDGIAVTLTPGGTGVPTFTPTPTTLYIGQRDGGTFTHSGYLSNIKLCDKARTWRDCK